jgi:NAD(P)-dependent dehydrogenase (short-subunit alcohol dehydrogenase family)
MGWYYVTGCDSGFGNIVVKQLDAAGHSVFAGCFSSDAMGKLEAETKNVVPVQLDVTNEASVRAAAETIAKVLDGKGLDGLVNNAGILVAPGPAEWTPVKAFDTMLAVNVVGAAAVTNSVLPMVRQAQGRIVNVASIAGRMGLTSQPAYCASKYAMEGYSEVLRRDMIDWGVTVHIIEPGVFPNTGLYAQVLFHYCSYSTYQRPRPRPQFQSGLDGLWDTLPGADETPGGHELRAEYGEKYFTELRERIGKALVQLGTADRSETL